MSFCCRRGSAIGFIGKWRCLTASAPLVRYRRRVGGCVGYLVRLEAARALLHYCWCIRAPIDWLYAEWWRNGLAFYAVDPAIVTHTGVRSTIRTLPKVRRTALEHTAAASHRLADWLYLRSTA